MELEKFLQINMIDIFFQKDQANSIAPQSLKKHLIKLIGNPKNLRNFENSTHRLLKIKQKMYCYHIDFFICGANDVVNHYEKRIKILHGCSFEG